MPEPHRLPSLQGLTITRIAVDDSLTIFCRGGEGLSAEIRIDGRFVYKSATDQTHFGCIEEDPSTAGPLLSLLFERLAGGCVTGEAALDLKFHDGSGLTACGEDHFLSWEIRDSRGLHAVCLADRDILIRNASDD